jgi:PBSX family phage portal protein
MNTEPTTTTVSNAASPFTFAFGDPEPVLNGFDLNSYAECWFNGRWYEPQFSFAGLAKTYKAAPYLATAIIFKRNFLSSLFIPNKYLSRQDFEQIALDFIWCGNAYLEKIKSRLGSTMQYKPVLAKYMRIGENAEKYYQLVNNHRGLKEHIFPKESIVHIREVDIDQELYGVPEYLAALQSAWLNESATLFRRKYYNNGSHAGFILYLNDAITNTDDVEKLKEQMKQSKGPGNFRNLFFYAPGGKKDGIQIIPVSEIAAKDDFTNIKSISRDDQLAMVRTPPQLLGIIPSNAGGFGDIEMASKIFWKNEIVPLSTRMLKINELVGMELIKFNPYVVTDSNAA